MEARQWHDAPQTQVTETNSMDASDKTATKKLVAKRATAKDGAPKEPARISRGPLAVAAVAGRITRPILGKRGLAEGDILSRWATIVGPTLAAYALPEQVKFPRGRREDGELLVRVSNGSFATSLQHDAPIVIERINGYFGYAAIRSLKIVQAPLPLRRPKVRKEPPPLSEAEKIRLGSDVSSVTDPELRAALERLGAAIRRRPT